MSADDLLTVLDIEPGKLGRALAAAAMWTSADKTLPGVRAVILRVDAAARTVRCVGTDRYRIMDVTIELDEHEGIIGDPILHDCWIPTPHTQALARDLRALKWARSTPAHLRTIEVGIERTPLDRPSRASLPEPWAGLCERAGLITALGDVAEVFGVTSAGDGSGTNAAGIMRLADDMAARPLATHPEPWAVNAHLIADLAKVPTSASRDHLSPWRFAETSPGPHGSFGPIRVTPTSPDVTPGVRYVGHIYPIRPATL